MRTWTKLLPWCVVAWFAKRHCETFAICGGTYVQPYKGALLLK